MIPKNLCATKRILYLTTLLSLSFVAAGLSSESNEYLLAPKCFIEKDNFEYTSLAIDKSQQPILFRVNSKQWLKHLDSIIYHSDCGRFINVTDDWQNYVTTNKLSPERISKLDYKYFLTNYSSANNLPSLFDKSNTGKAKDHPEALQKLFNDVNADRLWLSLDELTAFRNRASTLDTGVAAAGHIKKWMEQLASDNNLSEQEFSVQFIATNIKYMQPSVVAVLGKDLPGGALVLSAHLDTNGFEGGRRPGADDDGSGSMVVLEAARVLVSSGYKFDRPIYFMWYAAEEVGLIGSQKVVAEMVKDKVKIDSVLHHDTIGRRAKPNDPTLWLLQDYVNLKFTNYIANLIKNEVKLPVNYTKCGYACSDHASWHDKGFTVASPTALEDSPYWHTANDVKDHISLDHLVNYTKLAIAYAVDKGLKVD